MNSERKTILHLSLIEGIGAATINKIVEKQSGRGPLEAIYSYTHQDVMRYFYLTQDQATILVKGLSDFSVLEHECMLIEKHTIDITTIQDECYPDVLRHIVCPPPLLYHKGKALEKQMNGIAFVGARNATAYGKKFINRCVPPLVRHGFLIVSGGARGADSMAHEAALSCEGETVAVLGSGLLCLYPAQNKKLFDRIIANNGTLISIFPLTAPPLPGNFPARNRIIAGLSRGCVVVQAAGKSGALITADYALENGRDLFAVPGSIDDPLSVGCNALIAQGARLVTGAEDILVDWGIIQKKSEYTVLREFKKVENESPAQKIELLCATPCSTDELAQETAFSSDQLNQLLFDLQIAGVIVQNAAGLWEQKK